MHLNFLLLTPLPTCTIYFVILLSPFSLLHAFSSPLSLTLPPSRLSTFSSHFSYTLPFFLPLSPLEWTLSFFTHSNNPHLSYILSNSLYKPYFSFVSQNPLLYCGYISFLFLYILPSVFKMSSHFPVKHYSAYHKQSLLVFLNSSYFP